MRSSTSWNTACSASRCQDWNYVVSLRYILKESPNQQSFLWYMWGTFPLCLVKHTPKRVANEQSTSWGCPWWYPDVPPWQPFSRVELFKWDIKSCPLSCRLWLAYCQADQANELVVPFALYYVQDIWQGLLYQQQAWLFGYVISLHHTVQWYFWHARQRSDATRVIRPDLWVRFWGCEICHIIRLWAGRLATSSFQRRTAGPDEGLAFAWYWTDQTHQIGLMWPSG